VGDPVGGVATKYLGAAYGCGDVCLDMAGCPTCPTSITKKLEDWLPTAPSNSYVIYISLVLEYVDDDKIDFVLRELQRVSGGDLIIVHIPSWDLVTLHGLSYTKRKIIKAPPHSTTVTYENLTPLTAYLNINLF